MIGAFYGATKTIEDARQAVEAWLTTGPMHTEADAIKITGIQFVVFPFCNYLIDFAGRWEGHAGTVDYGQFNMAQNQFDVHWDRYSANGSRGGHR